VNVIYNMKLHEVKTPDDSFRVVRVPGGWIYYLKFFSETTAVFVPYNNEFEKSRKSL
jgi:hypothetical protein